MKRILLLLVVAILLVSGCTTAQFTVLVPGDEQTREQLQNEHGVIPDGTLLAIH